MIEHINGSDSFILSTEDVSVAITRQGGHMAPVVFHTSQGDFSPYALAPWTPDECEQSLPNLLKQLRGDFFCLPFGPQEIGAPHGDTANHVWNLIDRSGRQIILECDSQVPQARVKKSISLRPGDLSLYIEHEVTGLDGRYNYGSHPILDFSSMKVGQARLAVSPFRWASVYPGMFANPEIGERGILQNSAEFTALQSVPLSAGGTIDLTRYPTSAGHEDLVMMVSEAATDSQPFAWSAVTMGDMVWFSLKLIEDFPATLFWISNGGRSAHPWENRHTSRVGIEEVCSYFCDSVDQSRLDLLAHLNVPTTRTFSKDAATKLRMIQGATPVPADMGQVQKIVPHGDGILIVGENNHSVTLPIDLAFLLGES